MEFDFDIHGNLKPYRKVTCDLASLHLGFVAPFEGDSTRHQLFDAYLRYCDDLKNAIGGSSFVQW